MEFSFPFEQFDEMASLQQRLSLKLLATAEQSISRSGRFNVGLSGGSLVEFLRLGLAGSDLSGWNVYLVDERMVPEGHADSNCGSLRNALPGAQFHPVRTSLTAEDAAEEYSKSLPPGRLDMVVLGMGPDGHIASLFPGQFDPLETLPCLPIKNSPKPPAERVTLSISYLRECKEYVFVVTGAAKRPAVARTSAGDVELPASHLDLQRSLWLLSL